MRYMERGKAREFSASARGSAAPLILGIERFFMLLLPAETQFCLCFYKAWASKNKGSEFLYFALTVGKISPYTPNAREYSSSGDSINTHWLNWVVFRGTKK